MEFPHGAYCLCLYILHLSIIACITCVHFLQSCMIQAAVKGSTLPFFKEWLKKASSKGMPGHFGCMVES